MNINVINIGLFSDDENRAHYLNLLIEDTRRKIVTFKFTDLSNKYFTFDEFNLLIFDFASSPSININSILSLRSNKHLSQIPLLYLINDQQIPNTEALLKDKPSGILNDPFTEVEIKSLVANLEILGDLRKRQDLSNDLIESDKKLIYQIDRILQLETLEKVTSIDEFYFKIQKHVIHKIELTFAAERALFLSYDQDQNELTFNEFSETTGKIEKQKKFHIKSSNIKEALEKNSALILDKNMLPDPFVEELNDVIGLEIQSILFIPVTVLHQVRGAMIIVNKLYGKPFTEKDLALGLITLDKIVNYLETLYLKNLNPDDLSTVTTPDFLGDDDDYEYRYSKEIIDSIGFGLLVFNNRYRLLFANGFAKNTFRIDNIKDKNLIDILGEEAFDIIDNLVKSKDVPLLGQEILINDPENRQLYLGYSIYNIARDPEKVTFGLTFMEISQTKRIQAEIIRMDRMASLGVLASGIAHEIRNPLAGIKAMAQTLQEELEIKDSKNEYIERIVRQVNRLDELLKSFFSYARPQRPNPVRCNIPDIVREVLPLFRRKIKESNIIVKEIYSRNLKEIFVDFHQIEQVFFNLIINGIDAMKDGGTLTVRARLPEKTQPMFDRRQRIPKLFSDIYNEITISDTGIGMDSETLNNMYNPFFTTKTNGTGLGLSIVYQIILEHGGQITVDSEENKGTSFKISLPVYVKDQHKE